MALPTLLENVRQRPSMYVPSATYDTVVAYVCGYDAALMGGLLVGLREWLVVRLQEGNNLSWPAQMRRLILRSPPAPKKLETPDEHRTAIEFMFATLVEFLNERDAHDGLRRIHMAYDDWLRQQDWYGPSFPDWLPRGHIEKRQSGVAKSRRANQPRDRSASALRARKR